MEELLWAAAAIAAVIALRWWRRKNGELPAPQEPPGVTLPPPDEAPATLPFEPPPPLREPTLRERLRNVRRNQTEVASADDPDKKTERGYQLDIVAHLAGQGVTATAEHVLPDGARVDIVTATYAIEVDFAKKWAECIGQALFYAHMTGKKPVCLLLVGVEDKEPGVARLAAVCKRERIDVWLYDVKLRTLRILGVD